MFLNPTRMKMAHKPHYCTFLKKSVLLIAFLQSLIICSNAPGQTVTVGSDGGIEKINVGVITGTALKKDASLSLPLVTGEANEQTGLRKITNIISLNIKEETANYIPADFSATADITIEYSHTGLAADKKTQAVSLAVSYTKGEGVKYNAKNLFSFKGAEYVNIVIQKISISPATSGSVDMSQFVTVQNEARVRRYYKLSKTDVPGSFIQTPAADELGVQWQLAPAAGNNYTELEWTWLEDELAGMYTVGNKLNTDLLFKNNATRVDIPYGVNAYKIPLLYDGTGKLYYHARGVNSKGDGNRDDADWSTVQAYAFNGHESNLNWQATTSFAEDGKRKSVVQYFDGSLRSRQTVTKNNTDNTVISAETLYDQQGRPAIQVLPAPSISTVIQYIENLNEFNGQSDNADPAPFFDLQTVGSPTTLKTTSGASQYYSASNPQLNTGFNKNIPDAEGYPYTYTRYTPDGTGRVQSQSSVGATLKMGSGQETKYYYGTASQEELDALFGTEAGNNTHYFKNMVKDANGQMSVSYADMHGRTIATALAGDAAAGMQALVPDNTNYPNQSGTSVTRNLLNRSTNIVKGNTIESVNTILVPATTKYEFTYNLNPQALSLTSCTNTSLCYDCMYDLEIAITDEGGEASPVVRKFNNIKLNADNSCSTPVNPFQSVNTGAASSIAGNIITFSETLLPGSYSVRKTLTVSEASLQQYRDNWLAQGLCKTEQNIIDSVYSAMIIVTGCNADKPPVVACPGNLCNTTISRSLDILKQAMLADMMPYSGQYAVQLPATPSAMAAKYNIFSTSYSGQPFYKNPWNSSKGADAYYTAANVLDPLIYPGGSKSSSTLPALSNNDFEAEFAYSWANALLPHHPEYDKLNYATNNLAACYSWIDNFNSADAYSQAVANGYVYTPGSTTATPYNDPYYTTKATTAEQATMRQWVTSGYPSGTNLNMWMMAYGNIKCSAITNESARNSCFSNYSNPSANAPGGANFNALTNDEKDQAWSNFKALYAAERNKLVNKYLNTKVVLADTAVLVAQGFKLHFPNSNAEAASQMGWTWYPANNAPVQPNPIPTQNDIKTAYAGRCSSYMYRWQLELSQCAALANNAVLLNQITSGMEKVCEKGSDQNNPYGASTVAPATPVDGSPRSFEEVINNALLQNSINKNNLCNAFVIDYPKPYSKGPVMYADFVATVDTCNCRRFKTIQQEAQAAGYNTSNLTSLNQYLRLTYNDTITQVMYNSLSVCSVFGVSNCKTTYHDETVTYPCNTKPQCSNLARMATNQTTIGTDPGNCTVTLSCPLYDCQTTYIFPLTSPQPIPRFLECGYTGDYNCISCAQLSTLTAEFKTIFNTSPWNAAPVFDAASLTLQQDSANILYQQFINYRTGFQYSWTDYAKQADAAGCTVTQSNTGNATQVICGNQQLLTDTAGMFKKPAPCAHTYELSVNIAENIYQQRQQQLLANFDSLYRQKCLSAKDIEQFSVAYTSKEYHYTLYYYDMAGNLVKTVPPKGVRPDFSAAFVSAVETAKQKNKTKVPAHVLATNYRYNGLNAVIKQSTPDAGISSFWYDRLGRLAVSGNAQQAAAKKYSYTLYDVLGRITEVGQTLQNTAMTQAISQDDNSLNNWLTGTPKEQITVTNYDIAYPLLLTGQVEQKNLRNRVSWSAVYPDAASLTSTVKFTSATFYTYDIHGNVDTLLQDFGNSVYQPTLMNAANRFKRIAYDYDLISGKVNAVSYQPPVYDSDNKVWVVQPDAFYHRYEYDAENRLLNAYTSRDSMVWERDANYAYYKHGPLARTVLGQQQVQGLDYTYTLQGWLKGVNVAGSSGDADNAAGSVVAHDAYSYVLNYYAGDYKSIAGAMPTAALVQQLGAAYKPLYNGNISAMGVNISKLSGAMVYNYGYDQLNRLIGMDAFKSSNDAWSTLTATTDYKESIKYDPNGNIMTYLRNGQASVNVLMDNLTYTYASNTNQLTSINDAVASANYTTDIDKQNAGNYSYDAIGNLTGDAQAGITSIGWNVYGKIQSITKSSSTITYTYNTGGQRISKAVTGTGAYSEYYARDAQGNVLCIYKNSGNTVVPVEIDLYGSSRLGTMAGQPTAAGQSIALTAGWGSGTVSTFTRGEKTYELANHLGNVLATVSDKKISVSTNGTLLSYYTSDVTSASDNYPFGMQMPGRAFNTASYRYSINGQVRETELNENITTAIYWEYDSRIGRRWNLDPKPAIGTSDYSTFINNPILHHDPFGDKPTPREAAAIAAHVYGDKTDKILKGRWKVSERNFGIKKDQDNGLKSQIYERTRGGKTEYVYATAGTEDWTDILHDVIQPSGLSSQYNSSIKNAIRIDGILGKGIELTFTGHSLGGGEAAANAYATGRDAITFNAAGVSPLTIKANKKCRIDVAIMMSDPLNFIQNGSSKDVFPNVDGVRHYILPLDKPSLYNGHSMENMLKAFDIDPAKYSLHEPVRTDFTPTSEDIQRTWDGIIRL